MKALQRSELSQREACVIVRARRRPPREQYGIRAAQDKPLISRLTQPAQEHPRYGCKRLYVIYERQASELDPYINYKRFRPLYRLGNLQIAAPSAALASQVRARLGDPFGVSPERHLVAGFSFRSAAARPRTWLPKMPQSRQRPRVHRQCA